MKRDSTSAQLLPGSSFEELDLDCATAAGREGLTGHDRISLSIPEGCGYEGGSSVFRNWTSRVQIRGQRVGNLERGSEQEDWLAKRKGNSNYTDTVVLKLSYINLSCTSPLLYEFAEQFLPHYVGDLRYFSGRAGGLASTTPISCEVFLLHSCLDPGSLSVILEALKKCYLVPSALHLGSNPALGERGIAVLADFIRESSGPLRWLALTKCLISTESAQELFSSLLSRPDLYPRSELGQLSVPLWLDFGTALQQRCPGSAHSADVEGASSVVEFLDQTIPGLYCRATDRAACGINRCGNAGKVFHLPNFTELESSYLASMIVPEKLLGGENPEHSSSSSLNKLDCSADNYSVVSSLEEMNKIMRDDEDRMSMIDSEEEEDVLAIPSSSLEKEVSVSSEKAQQLTSSRGRKREGRACVGAPSKPLDSFPLWEERRSADVGRLKEYYGSLLKEAYGMLSLIAAKRQIFPVQFLRDLSSLYLSGELDVELPFMWEVQSESPAPLIKTLSSLEADSWTPVVQQETGDECRDSRKKEEPLFHLITRQETQAAQYAPHSLAECAAQSSPVPGGGRVRSSEEGRSGVSGGLCAAEARAADEVKRPERSRERVPGRGEDAGSAGPSFWSGTPFRGGVRAKQCCGWNPQGARHAPREGGEPSKTTGPLRKSRGLDKRLKSSAASLSGAQSALLLCSKQRVMGSVKGERSSALRVENDSMFAESTSSLATSHAADWGSVG